MSKKIIILIVLGFITLLLISMYLIHRLVSITPPPIGQGNTTFPISSSTQSETSTTSAVLQISVQNNQMLTVSDFIHNGSTVLDPVNKGRYLVAGSLGYCNANQDCTATDEDEYNIFYDQPSNSFTIGLLIEPLGDTRRHAEKFLAKVLGIQEKQLCTLKYYIGTTYQVNDNYDAGNLGFSMCDDAVKLPQ